MNIKENNLFDRLPVNFTAADFCDCLIRIGEGFKIITGYCFIPHEFETWPDPFEMDIYIFRGDLRIKK